MKKTMRTIRAIRYNAVPVYRLYRGMTWTFIPPRQRQRPLWRVLVNTLSLYATARLFLWVEFGISVRGAGKERFTLQDFGRRMKGEDGRV